MSFVNPSRVPLTRSDVHQLRIEYGGKFHETDAVIGADEFNLGREHVFVFELFEKDTFAGSDDQRLNSCIVIGDDLKIRKPCSCGNNCDMMTITVLDPGALLRSRYAKDTSQTHSKKSKVMGKSLRIKVLEYEDAADEERYQKTIGRDSGCVDQVEQEAGNAETVAKAVVWKHTQAVLHDNGAKVISKEGKQTMLQLELKVKETKGIRDLLNGKPTFKHQGYGQPKQEVSSRPFAWRVARGGGLSVLSLSAFLLLPFSSLAVHTYVTMRIANA